MGRRAELRDDHGWVVSTILLVLAVLFLVVALREILGGDDPDAPPPKWMTMLSSMTPAKAFFLVRASSCSRSSCGSSHSRPSGIGHAHLDRTDNIITYIVFVLLAVSAHLAVVVAAAIFPERSKSLLDRAAGCKTTTG